jgi:phosphoribosyl-AMP cyclohydrolase
MEGTATSDGRTDRDPVDLKGLRFDERGLITVVTQDIDTGEVLMVAWANLEAIERTLAEGRMVYWSRSRGELWRKGDTSGHVQHWSRLLVDCDADVIVARVHQEGPACHTGERSCFFRRLAGSDSGTDPGTDQDDSAR